MAKTYRLGVIGFAHMHINNLMAQFAKLPNVEWVACADTKPAVPSRSMAPDTRGWNIKHAQEVIGIPKVYDCYHEMLEKEKFDIVIFCPENARHGEVGEAIASKGIHMLCEKPMASNLSGALRMVRAAKANDVRLMINWPSAWSPSIRTMKRLIDEGAIGDVWEVKARNAASMGPFSHNPPFPSDAEKGAEWWHQAAPGGGALLDYCCYGACAARWFTGTPAVAATAMKANMMSKYGDAEDNAVIVVRFPNAMAVIEGTWSTIHPGVSSTQVVYGTKGTMAAVGRNVEIYTGHTRGVTAPDRVVEGDPLPKGRETLAEEFIHHIETGEPLHPMVEPMQNLEVMAILDAGARAAASGKMELVNDFTWNIG